MNQDTLSDATIYVFGPYTLDPRFRRLLYQGAIVPLTTKAFDTLEVLVRSAGHTVTKDELLKQVWTGTFVQEDTLSQNISTIRRALADTPDSPRYVLTVPREGYRFIARVKIVHPQPIGEGSRQSEQPADTSVRRFAPNWISRWRVQYIAGAAFALVLAATSLLLWSLVRLPSPAPMGPVSTFEVFEPEGTRFSTTGGMLAMSPDGRHLVFIASDADGQDNLWIRSLGSLESTRLPGTLDAAQPFWSADSRSVAFFSGGYLRRIDIAGGPSRPVCKLGPGGRAGSWSRDGQIIFAVNGKGLFQVPASGGTPAQVSVPGMGSCQYCEWPAFLPDGRQFLFMLNSATTDRGIYVSSLNGAEPRRVLGELSSVTYVDPGYLFYASAGALVARRFDPVRAQVSGDEVPVAERVWVNEGTRRAVFSVSQDGLLAYREPLATRLRWISRAGDVISSGPKGFYRAFEVSRDGRVLTTELDPQLGTTDLYLHDSAWTARTRLTFDRVSESRAIWSVDESRVVFAREGPNGWQLYDVSIERPGVERPLLPVPSPKPATPVSWDGDIIEYWTWTDAKLWRARAGRVDHPALIAEADPADLLKRVSPDGKWLAYAMNVADLRPPHTALFVQPWRDGGSGRWEIASDGSQPVWRSDSRELFFIAPGGRLMAQRIDGGRVIGAPAQLCTTEALEGSGVAGWPYAAASDGQRFLVKVPARRSSIIVMSSWPPLAER